MNFQVTKPKHPGRVAACNKLVEFNRKKKEEQIKNKSQVDLSDEPSANEVESSTSSSTYSSYSTGAAIVAIAGVAVFLLWKHDISPKTSSEPPENDIFRMN